jgi:hypothetical protein
LLYVGNGSKKIVVEVVVGALFLARWVEDGVAECRDLMTADGALKGGQKPVTKEIRLEARVTN